MAANITGKQQRFVDEYLIDLNATAAAIRAGYTSRSAEVTGSRLLRNAKVNAILKRSMDKRAERTEMDQDRVLREIARLAFSDVRKIFDGNSLKRMDKIDDATAAAISSVKVSTRQGGDGAVESITEIKLWPKTPALEMAGKHLGLFEKDNAQKNSGKAIAESLTREELLAIAGAGAR